MWRAVVVSFGASTPPPSARLPSAGHHAVLQVQKQPMVAVTSRSPFLPQGFPELDRGLGAGLLLGPLSLWGPSVKTKSRRSLQIQIHEVKPPKISRIKKTHKNGVSLEGRKL